MLNEKEIEEYLESKNVGEAARNYILETRSAPPSRFVGRYATTNLRGAYASKKMGATVNFESYSIEMTAFILADSSPDILEFWDQPEPVRIEGVNKNGKKRHGTYTPDMLILTEDQPIVVEVKSEAEVRRLVDSHPEWVERDGQPIFLPAEAAFGALNLEFRVWTIGAKEINEGKNRAYISTAMAMSESVSPETEQLILAAFNRHCAWILSELKNDLGLESYTPILSLIGKGALHLDIENDLVSNPDNCRVVRDQAFLKRVEEILPDSRSLSLTRVPSAKAANAALVKLQRIDSGEKSRSVRRWRKRIADAAGDGLTSFQALLNNDQLKGNRTRRLPRVVVNFLVKYLKAQHGKLVGISMYRSYCRYTVQAKEAYPDHPPASYQTFLDQLSRVPDEHLAYQAGGRRFANNMRPPTDPLLRASKAGVAWEAAAIDHYLADVYTIVHDDLEKPIVDRPWVTAMIDLYSGMVLAVSVSYSPPSKKSAARVIRRCVEKWGKLPRTVVVDNGSDFKSTYFASLLANYAANLVFRPAGHSRFGGEIERLFGEIKEKWLCTLPGNLASRNGARTIDGAKAPRNCAVLSPKDFLLDLLTYCELRNTHVRGDSLETIQLKFQNSERDFGFIGIPVVNDKTFQIISAVDSGDYKVNFQRGIHVGERWHSCPEIQRMKGKLKHLHVRIDPDNPYVVYAKIEDSWIDCFAGGIQEFNRLEPQQALVNGVLKLDCKAKRRQVALLQDQELDIAMRLASENRAKESSPEPLNEAAPTTHYSKDQLEAYSVEEREEI